MCVLFKKLIAGYVGQQLSKLPLRDQDLSFLSINVHTICRAVSSSVSNLFSMQFNPSGWSPNHSIFLLKSNLFFLRVCPRILISDSNSLTEGG